MSCVVRFACGKTTTNIRVDAAVIHYLWGVTTSTTACCHHCPVLISHPPPTWFSGLKKATGLPHAQSAVLPQPQRVSSVTGPVQRRRPSHRPEDVFSQWPRDYNRSPHCGGSATVIPGLHGSPGYQWLANHTIVPAMKELLGI